MQKSPIVVANGDLPQWPGLRKAKGGAPVRTAALFARGYFQLGLTRNV